MSKKEFVMQSAFKGRFTLGEEIRILLPVGAGMDLLTGKFYTTPSGSSHLNGGFNKLMGIGGRGNTFKSTLARYFTVTGMGRYFNLGGQVYDTEDSVDQERALRALAKYEKYTDSDFVIDNELFQLVGTDTLGDEWFDALKETSVNKIKDFEKHRLTTPFITKDGENVTMLPPSFNEVDSLSMMPIAVTEGIYDKNSIGDSGMNVEAMRSAAAKNQMLTQMPRLTSKSATYMSLVAHMGDEIVMDQYAPSTKKLSFMKAKLKFKGVPERYTFLMNTMFACISATPLTNRSDKGPEYPRYAKERNPTNDLMVIDLQVLRCKTAPTGNITRVVTSQEEGVLPALTDLHNLRVEYKYYGLGGNNTTFNCVLRPDVSMTRTNAREKIEKDALLCRALNICHELKQLHEWHRYSHQDVLVSPEELYNGLKAKGYDWDKLLNTRGYWVFLEQEAEEPLRELTSLDLLNMLAGKYTPPNDKDYR